MKESPSMQQASAKDVDSGVRAESDSLHEVFIENSGCPFCAEPSGVVLSEVQYYETADCNRLLPDIKGQLFECQRCGVAFPSHQYRLEAFPQLYEKTFKDIAFLDDSPLQTLRKRYLKAILKRAYDHPLSRLLDAVTLHVLQVPRLTRIPRNLRLLDVGCGFGEFLSIYQSLANECTGTEVIPQLVERLRGRGLRCEFGELEEVDLGDGKFDVILLRAVFYRTRHPRATLERLKSLLAPSGEIALLDPCAGLRGAEYFFRKHFPQGQFYIVDPERYLEMLGGVHELEVVSCKQIYGRPKAIVKTIRSITGNLGGLAELAIGNLLHVKPYMLVYTVRPSV